MLAVFFSVQSLTAQENRAAPVAREEAAPQRQAGDQQRRDDRARNEKQIIFWFSTITAGTISGIALLFFLVFRAQRAKAIRLQDAPLSELWRLPHLSGLDSNACDLWVLSPPANSMSAYWTLLSRQDDSVFGLKILRKGAHRGVGRKWTFHTFPRYPRYPPGKWSDRSIGRGRGELSDRTDPTDGVGWISISSARKQLSDFVR